MKCTDICTTQKLWVRLSKAIDYVEAVHGAGMCNANSGIDIFAMCMVTPIALVIRS